MRVFHFFSKNCPLKNILFSNFLQKSSSKIFFLWFFDAIFQILPEKLTNKISSFRFFSRKIAQRNFFWHFSMHFFVFSAKIVKNYFSIFQGDLFIFSREIAQKKITLAFFNPIFHFFSENCPQKISLFRISFKEVALKILFVIFRRDFPNFFSRHHLQKNHPLDFLQKNCQKKFFLTFFNANFLFSPEKLLKNIIFWHFSMRYFHYLSDNRKKKKMISFFSKNFLQKNILVIFQHDFSI